MRVLLDTNVVSEFRRVSPDPRVVQRVREVRPEDTYLSVITVGELVYGVQRLPAGKKRRALEAWVLALEQSYAPRILAVDSETTHAWGELTATCEAGGKKLPPQDGLIAATALRNGLHLMTRNVKNFESTGVLVINPWEA
jgi:predicted nucleic acid-binding protein